MRKALSNVHIVDISTSFNAIKEDVQGAGKLRIRVSQDPQLRERQVRKVVDSLKNRGCDVSPRLDVSHGRRNDGAPSLLL